MIGNDIVDFKQAYKDSNWQRSRYLDKVYTEREKEYIFTSKDQHRTVWLLWSMKEAAYKIYIQQYGKHFFNPKRLICTLLSEESGMVSIDGNIYHTTSTTTEDYVFTVAKTDVNEKVNSGCFQIETSNHKSQSLKARQNFLEIFPRETASLAIRKDKEGVPKLFLDNIPLDYSFSLTHHGLFCGFSF